MKEFTFQFYFDLLCNKMFLRLLLSMAVFVTLTRGQINPSKHSKIPLGKYSILHIKTLFLIKQSEIKVMPILRFLNVCICTVLKRLRTEEHCRPMADKIKWIGWRTPIGHHVIPACVPIGGACTL